MNHNRHLFYFPHLNSQQTQLMKYLLFATLSLALFGTNSAVAELAIDGKGYEEAIPVTINNITTDGVDEWSVTWRIYGSSYKVKSGQRNPLKTLKVVDQL